VILLGAGVERQRIFKEKRSSIVKERNYEKKGREV